MYSIYIEFQSFRLQSCNKFVFNIHEIIFVAENNMHDNQLINAHRQGKILCMIIIDIPINIMFQTSDSSKIFRACTFEDKYFGTIK